MMDRDVFLRAQFVDKLLHGGGLDNCIRRALDKDTGGGAGREE